MALLSALVDEADRWEVEPEELHQLLEERGAAPFHLLDCREEEEHVEWRIGQEAWLPLSNFPLAVSQWWDACSAEDESEERPVVVYCHHGIRSLQATQYLRAKGFLKTYSLRGGIDAWSQHGYGMEGTRFASASDE